MRRVYKMTITKYSCVNLGLFSLVDERKAVLSSKKGEHKKTDKKRG